MILFYHFVSFICLVLALPFLPIVWLASEKRRANLLQRLGLFTGFKKKRPGTYRVWVHALSVGEVKSSIPFVIGLREKRPDAEIVFTASTRTGYGMACQLLKGDGKTGPVSQIGYFPFDLWLSVLRVTSRIQPDLICLIETDLWPGFLSQMKTYRIPVVLINARLSSRSLKGYLRLGKFGSLFFSGLSHVMAQTREDAKRFQLLHIPGEKISISGNIKFDQPVVSMDVAIIKELKRKFGLQNHHRVWIAGSTHEGEEEVLVEVFGSLKKKYPELKLILAPRDPKRSWQLISQLPMNSYRPVCLSTIAPESKIHDIVFIDCMGELAAAYAICDFAFVGGSLVAQGGHNPLEPAMFGKPVLFGPHMTDFQEISGLLRTAGGAKQVDNLDSLTGQMENLLTDSGCCSRMGKASQAVFLNNSGAVGRTLETMEGLSLV